MVLPQGSMGSARARRTLAALRDRITSGEWPINTKIPNEQELVELLGVGRTTVREAVRSLATLGILETRPGIGTFVRSRTPVSTLLTEWIADFDISEVLGYRRALEVEASQLAATHRTDADLENLRAALEPTQHRPTGQAIDRSCVERGRTPGEFHTAMFEATHNKLLLSLYTGTLAVLRTAVNTRVLAPGASEAARDAEHAAILAAISDRDAAEAAHLMAAHTDHDLVLGALPRSVERSS